ncbi:MAG TPA: hypothetical protein VE243_11065, partial [Candidatus Acidoferrum sp.]|nr:hypothetical protein [Candidatus Acidoferrum sp.]
MLNRKMVGGEEHAERTHNRGSRQSVGTREDPYDFRQNYAIDEARLLRRTLMLNESGRGSELRGIVG